MIEIPSKGDTYQIEPDSLFTSGIDLGDHGSAIEVHRNTKEEAEALRDIVLESLEAWRKTNA